MFGPDSGALMFRPGIWRVYVVIGLDWQDTQSGFFFLFIFFPPFLLCFIGIEKCGWRKACALADKIWEIIDVGLGGWQSKKTRHVLERCLVRRSALVIKDTDKKAADWRIRCRCWTCQTILKANLFCFKCGNTKSTAWGTDFLKLF